jgi:hypothetical protein
VTEGGGIGHAAMGETHEIAYVDLPAKFAKPMGKLRSAKVFKRFHKLIIDLHESREASSYTSFGMVVP